jgi:hypothetical protein
MRLLGALQLGNVLVGGPWRRGRGSEIDWETGTDLKSMVAQFGRHNYASMLQTHRAGSGLLEIA